MTKKNGSDAEAQVAPEQPGPEQVEEAKVEYSTSAGLAQRLARDNISFAFTSYQSGLLYFIGRNAEGGINVHQSAMPKPMGLCLDGDTGLLMTAGFQIMRFENTLEQGQQINNTFDACYCHVWCTSPVVSMPMMWGSIRMAE